MKIASLSKEPVRVSDHAVLRYMERAMGLNVEIVRSHIADLCAWPAAYGAVTLRSEGVRFEISGNTVVTVRPDVGGVNLTAQKRNSDKIARAKCSS